MKTNMPLPRSLFSDEEIRRVKRLREIESDERLIKHLESKMQRAGFARRARYSKRIRAALTRLAANRLVNS